MIDPIVPAATKLAAKRGFIRTATQSLAAAIPTTGIAVVLSGDWALSVALGAGGAIVTSLLAGAASALSILSRGIPGDYADATLSKQAVLNESERVADMQAAVSRVLNS